MKFLVVDDSKAMRMIVMRSLRQAGYESDDYVEAGNGVEALAQISQCQPDFVLSDWNMPEMTGIDLLRNLRKQNNPVRFGFITSEGTPEMKDIATSEGALFIITKPFTPASVALTIASNLT